MSGTVYAVHFIFMTDEKYLFSVPQKALIKKDGKFLIIKRSKDTKSYPDHWDLPGGKLERGESPEDGLKREVMEETSLQINVDKPIFSYLETAKAFAYVIVFECVLIGGEIKLSHEHSEYKWVDVEELKSLLVEPYLKEFFAKK